MIKATATFRPRNSAGQFTSAVITPGAVAGATAAAQAILTAAQLYCPVDTGALLASGKLNVDQSGATVVARVEFTEPYASFVEYGTGQRGDPDAPYPHVENWVGMVAQPYLRPAVDENRTAIKDLFASNLSLALSSKV